MSTTTPPSAAAAAGPGLPSKVLIANRGEIAVRIARTCRTMGIGTVAVYSDVDAHAWHVAACDEAIRIGGAAPSESYLRADALVEAALAAGAEAVHPGYGFLAEAAGFATQVLDAGLTWVGPPPAAITAMGDKLAAKRAMAAAGVPLVPGSDLGTDLSASDVDLAELAAAIGFPVMVKAAAGGGGKGMRVVHEPAALAEAVAAARREAGGAFGDDRIFLERYVERPRHLEVQVLADGHGRVLHLFERECSVQRRHQKVVEESPAPGIDERVRTALGEAAVAAAAAIGYVNAGTVEFIGDESVLARLRAGADLDPREAFAFLEVNTRLQVEHPVTEQVVRVRDRRTGALERLDLVREQLLVAAGEPLAFSQQDLVQRGHAIEVRLYAEDPAGGYLPQTGTLHAYRPRGLDGLRWDSGVRAGDVISPHYDPMLAKVIADGPTRREAAARLARELDTTVLLGAVTNRDLLVGVLRDPAFLAGDTTTAFLDERFPEGVAEQVAAVPVRALRSALVAAALTGTLAARAASPVLVTLPTGFANAATVVPFTVLDHGGRRWRVEHREQRDGSWAVRVVPGEAPEDDGPHPDATTHRVVLVGPPVPVAGAAGPGATVVDLALELDGHRVALRVARHGEDLEVVTPDGRVVLHEQPRFPDTGGEQVTGASLAPMPGTVVTVAVEVGARVEPGAVLASLEAMKMEHRITAAVAGTVTEVRVRAGQQVDAGEVLVVVDDDDDRAGEPAG